MHPWVPGSGPPVTRWRRLLLAAALLLLTCGAASASQPAETDGGWIPVAGPPQPPARSAAQQPQFGSRLVKARLPRQQEVIAVASSTTPRPPTPSPSPSKAPNKSPSSPKPTRARPPRQEVSSTTPSSSDDTEEETKSLAQQVAEGKYGLIQNELFAKGPHERPGILSYAANLEVPTDTADTLGGLRPDEIWLSEGHVLVLSAAPLGTHEHWDPIDDYQAPPRPIKLPPNPSVPPPFPVQLKDGGPTGFITSNGTHPLQYPPHLPPPGNWEPGNGIFPPGPPPFPRFNGSRVPPPSFGLFRQENLTQDDDDPSIFYPPPYDFSYHADNSSLVPPGPLVPGIVLPPPPNFFAPLNRSAEPELFVPEDIHKPHRRPPYLPPDLAHHKPPYVTNELPHHQPAPYVPNEIPHRRPAPYVPHELPQRKPAPYVPTELPHELDRLPPLPDVSNLVTPAPASDRVSPPPSYPYKEPQVYLHHHGSPVFLINTSHVQVSPPEQLVVYEIASTPAPPPRNRGAGRTVVTSTPAPATLYYTLPPATNVKFTIFTAAPATEPPPPNAVRQHLTETTFFRNTPKPQPFTPKPRPKYRYPEATTPTPPPTTPAPVLYNPVPKGRYIPNIQDDFYYDPQPPRLLPARPQSGYYYNQPPARRPEPLYYNPRPETNFYFPPPPPRRPVYSNYYQPPRPTAQPQVGFYYPPPQRNPSSTPNPIFNNLYTPNDEKYMDDITKNYFSIFGQKLTTPLPPTAAPTEPIPPALSLADDTRVNYRRPLPPINPDSELVDVRPSAARGRDPSVVSYQLPGQNQRGPSHYFFLTPRQVAEEASALRVPRHNPPARGASPTRVPRQETGSRGTHRRAPDPTPTSVPRPPVSRHGGQ